MRTLAILLLLTASASAQQRRDCHWNGYFWECFGPSVPPDTPRQLIPRYEYEPRPPEPDIYEEFHRWGGYDRRPCFDQFGRQVRCR
jgi:hypothetical protein